MDYKFSIIVPCFRSKFDEVKRNLDSILDQDYKNWEIIFVPNGSWTGKKSLIQKVKREYKMVKILDLEEANVCTARNKGAEIATGDIFSFLSSDLALHPGTLRTWQLEFTKHLECGFVYSGYRFYPNVETDVYPSEEFDPYKLDCYNYIDGANPVRREFNKPFDPEIRSLNDWDWILSIVKNGIKGYYIPEPMYSAELPKPGGLSWDSSTNWLNRTDKIKKKHGIPSREICCTSFIAPDEALRIAKAIGADYHSFPAQKQNRYKTVYVYGFACNDEYLQAQAGSLSGEISQAQKVIHWIGVDVTLLSRRPWGEVEALTRGIFANIKHHWVISNDDEAVLRAIFAGSAIDVKKVYPPIEKLRTGKLHDQVYINDWELGVQIALAAPDIEITNRQTDKIPRMSVHFQDRPANVIRAAAEGSFVITEKLLPHTGRLACTNIPEMRAQILHTIRQTNKDGYKKDKAAVKYYAKGTYFKNKIGKITSQFERKLGRLEDVMDTFSKKRLQA